MKQYVRLCRLSHPIGGSSLLALQQFVVAVLMPFVDIGNRIVRIYRSYLFFHKQFLLVPDSDKSLSVWQQFYCAVRYLRILYPEFLFLLLHVPHTSIIILLTCPKLSGRWSRLPHPCQYLYAFRLVLNRLLMIFNFFVQDIASVKIMDEVKE